MCDSVPGGQHLLDLSDQKIGHSHSAYQRELHSWVDMNSEGARTWLPCSLLGFRGLK